MNDLLGVKPSFSINPAEYVDLKKDIELGHSPHPAHDADEKKKKKKKKKNRKKKATTKPNQTMDHSLTLFFGEVDTVKEEMQKVRELLGRLQSSHEESKKPHKAGAMREIRERMEEDVGEVLGKVRSIKAKLEEMDRSKDHGYGGDSESTAENTAMDRARCSIAASLRKKLKDLMQEFQELREKVMSENREAVQRRIYTVTGRTLDEASVDRMICTGESENFLQRAIQETGKGRAIESVVLDIQERHDAVKEMGRSLLELHQLFLDMSVLVESQGEQLDCIQHHVSMAHVYVDCGTGQLRSAKKSQSRSRKWVVASIVILLVLIVVILVPVLKSFKTS